jgi:mRNA interferase RelE/StbE
LDWIIDYTDSARKTLKKIDKTQAKKILDFMDFRIALRENPRDIGEALKGQKLGEFWRYRVGDYRIVCNIEDEQVRVLVVRIGNRKEIYRK